MKRLGFSLTPKRTYLCPPNKSKRFKIVDVITVSNNYSSKILGQDLNIRPFLDSRGNSGDHCGGKFNVRGAASSTVWIAGEAAQAEAH